MTKRPEDALQIACANYCRLVLPPSVLWHHSANERQGAAAGARAKAMGQRAGFPDFIFIWRDAAGQRVAFVELKSPTGRLSQEQEDFLGLADDLGTGWALCRSLDDFVVALNVLGVPTKARRAA